MKLDAFRTTAACAALLCVALTGCGDSTASDGGNAARRGDDGPLILAVMPEIPPYAYIDRKTGEIRGIDIDIVKAAAARLGRPLKIRRVPFSDVVPSVKDGRADFAAAGLTITEGRRRNVDFSIPYATEGTAFLYRTGETVPTMIVAETARVAVVESMVHDFYLTRHGIDPRRYSSLDEALAALMSHEVDMIAYDRPAVKTVADASNGRLSVTPLETRELYGIAVRKDRPDCLAAVNSVIMERKSK